MIYVLVSLLGGCAAAFQATVNTRLARMVGIIEASFVVHLVGTLTALLLIFLSKFHFKIENLKLLTQVPFYTYVGGILGVAVVSSIMYAVPRIGVTLTMALLILGQMIIGLVIDNFSLLGLGRFPLSLQKIIGVLLLLFGVYLIKGEG